MYKFWSILKIIFEFKLDYWNASSLKYSFPNGKCQIVYHLWKIRAWNSINGTFFGIYCKALNLLYIISSFNIENIKFSQRQLIKYVTSFIFFTVTKSLVW